MNENSNNISRDAQFFENMVKYTQTSLAYLDREFNFLFVNAAYTEGCGMTQEMLLGRNYFDLFPDEANRKLFEDARETGKIIEFKAKPLTYTEQPWRGITYWDWTLSPVKGEDGSVQGLVLSLSNVTEREKARLCMEEAYTSLKQAEKEHFCQNTLLQVILNYAQACIAVLQGRELRCVIINPRLEEIVGPSSRVLGKTFREIFPELALRGDEARLQKVMETGELWEIHNYSFSGHEKRWDGYAVRLPVIAGDEPSVLMVCYETTKYWYAQEVFGKLMKETVEQQSRLLATISSIAAGVVIYDNYGNIVEMNHMAMEMLQYSAHNYHPSFLERWLAFQICKPDGSPYRSEEIPLCRALKGEIIRDEEILINKNPDKPVYISATLAPISDNAQNQHGVVFVFTDITERKRKEADLLASERELLKVTINSLREGVIAISPDERIIFINNSAADIIGYSESNALGRPIHDIFYIMDDQTSEPVTVTVGASGARRLVLVTHELKEIAISLSTSPIKTVDGRIIGTVVVFQDITTEKKMEQEILKAEKLEALGILAGGIAHDFNNILAAILTNIQLISFKIKKNEDVGEYLLNTEKIARKASELTKQLLTFSRGGAPVRKDASLVDLIKDTAEFILRGAKIKADYQIPADLWEASVDEGQISQVFQNLVLNAKQAMPRGGTLKISAANITVGEDSHLKPGNYVKITFTDCGEGISKENLSKIFDPFFTTKKDGNGLGLATSYSIVMQHEGYIEVESVEGQGTTFTVYLPSSNTLTPKIKTIPKPFFAGSSFKILLMDDELVILSNLREMLEYYGHRVVLATDGAEAIALYKQAAEMNDRFDVVIMDLTIPGGMGGQEAIAQLRDYDPKVKAIVSSGYANDPIMAEYERYGFCGVVSKPYKIDELNEILYQVVNPSQLRLGMYY